MKPYPCINCASDGCAECDQGRLGPLGHLKQRWKFRKTRVRLQHRPFDCIVGISWSKPDEGCYDRFWTWNLCLPFVRLQITKNV